MEHWICLEPLFSFFFLVTILREKIYFDTIGNKFEKRTREDEEKLKVRRQKYLAIAILL